MARKGAKAKNTGASKISETLPDDADEPLETVQMKPKSIMQCLDNLQWGRNCYQVNCINQARDTMVKRHISSFQTIQSSERSTYLHTFQRRITSLAWHKSRPFLLAVGDKFGNMIVAQQHADEPWDRRGFLKTIEVDGGGAGSSLTALKFHDTEPATIFRASLDGTVAKFDLENLKNTHVYHNTEKWEVWFTAMDVSTSTNTMLTGDNKGNILLHTLDGERVSQTRLHTSKILHCEFNSKLPYLIATSALEPPSKSEHVKLWDLRNLKRTEPLVTLNHNTGVNVAHFNPLDGSRLLTSDQSDEIRIYQGPLWHPTQIIKQGHRQFQHITPIKASWHPLYDIVVIGLYPSKEDKVSARSIQFYSADTGKLVSELYPPEPALVSLNEFNPTGEVLASGMGTKLILWKSKCDLDNESSSRSNLENKKNITSGVRNVLRGRGARTRGEETNSDDEESDDDSLKKKSKRKTGTSAAKRKTKATESKTASKRGKRK